MAYFKSWAVFSDLAEMFAASPRKLLTSALEMETFVMFAKNNKIEDKLSTKTYCGA